MKICRGCGVEFHPTNNRHYYCTNKCCRITQKSKYKESARKSNIKYNYSISWDTWVQMYNRQEGKCTICGKFCSMYPNSKRDGLCVDHCHSTGRIRSLLCYTCNSAIGQLKEDPKIIQNALEYILRERKK